MNNAIKVSALQQARFYARVSDNSFAAVYFMYASRISRYVSHCSFLNKIYHVLVYYGSILVTEKKDEQGGRVLANGSGKSWKCVFVIYIMEYMSLLFMWWNEWISLLCDGINIGEMSSYLSSNEHRILFSVFHYESIIICHFLCRILIMYIKFRLKVCWNFVVIWEIITASSGL